MPTVPTQFTKCIQGTNQTALHAEPRADQQTQQAGQEMQSPQPVTPLKGTISLKQRRNTASTQLAASVPKLQTNSCTDGSHNQEALLKVQGCLLEAANNSIQRHKTPRPSCNAYNYPGPQAYKMDGPHQPNV